MSARRTLRCTGREKTASRCFLFGSGGLFAIYSAEANDEGGGVGGAIICGLLGLSVVAGIACGGVLALIAMFGCEEAKKRVCRNARG
ncbi:halocin C8-like domain-containing protein [Corynebacterium pseudodiphtheriticum]|uniref:halocin C8-like domain-containing protein n=1 Tax=Corynebacterium pseudodiphtheriticum TaxID=37637 RepID=UPI003AF28A0F